MMPRTVRATLHNPSMRRGQSGYSRGHITVLDRPKLEQRACECYAVVKKEMGRLLPETTASRNAKTLPGLSPHPLLYDHWGITASIAGHKAIKGPIPSDIQLLHSVRN